MQLDFLTSWISSIPDNELQVPSAAALLMIHNSVFLSIVETTGPLNFTFILRQETDKYHIPTYAVDDYIELSPLNNVMLNSFQHLNRLDRLLNIFLDSETSSE